MSVTVTVDVRTFPMEIAKQMLDLGRPLSFALGSVEYVKAEIKLLTLLQVLSDYREQFFDAKMFSLEKRSVERFVTLHLHNSNLKASQARQLLDMLNYFPSVAEYPYEVNLDAGERSGD